MKHEPKYASDPGHPDYDLYMTLKAQVMTMHAELGIAPGDLDHRTTVLILSQYKRRLMSGKPDLDPNEPIDGVILSDSEDDVLDGKYLIVYQSPDDDPRSEFAKRMVIPTDLLNDPVLRQLDDINEINARVQQLEQERQRRLQTEQQRSKEQEAVQQSMGSRSQF